MMHDILIYINIILYPYNFFGLTIYLYVHLMKLCLAPVYCWAHEANIFSIGTL